MSDKFKKCYICAHLLANPDFQDDVWDVMRFGEPHGKTEEEWAEEAKSHEPGCPWVELRGDCFWSA